MAEENGPLRLDARRIRVAEDEPRTLLDKRMGLTPGRVVTEVRYRPRMNDAERQRLYYTDQDYIMFEHEEMCERAGREMRRIEMRRIESRIRAQRISGGGTGSGPRRGSAARSGDSRMSGR